MSDPVENVNAELRAGREVTVEEAQAATRGAVHQLALLVHADPPVEVEVWDAWHRDWYAGQVEAWRGDRVSVRYSRGPGLTHLVWLPADAVRRVEPVDGERA